MPMFELNTALDHPMVNLEDENQADIGATCWKIAMGKEKLAECPEHIFAAITSPLSNLSSVLSTKEAKS